MMRLFLLFFLLATSFALSAQIPEITLSKGLTISQSCVVKADKYNLTGDTSDLFPAPGDPASAKPALLVSGENITVDFQYSELLGSPDKFFPNGFYGLAIRVTGKNITLRNVRIRGYKVALLAENVDGLSLENCDVSYNYRPKLYSGREHECFSDWLSYHHNDRDEWLRYGAGIYLKNCRFATVRGCRATGNQNGLLMSGCTRALVYNNFFHYNSGLGIGLYRSSFNRIMHNRLEWNVRGYSHEFYERGQDSAGILVYEQSNGNLIAFNSASHSGDGLFLWAGQTTMVTGEGGCNDNLIYGNDFSYAATNGIEATFSRNRIQGNYMADCTYGIWAGYSYGSLIFANMMVGCRTAIAIEHGQNDTILQNIFVNDTAGIQLWARANQPQDWGYAQKRDVRSRDIVIDRNVFMGVRKPLKISASKNVYINGENLFTNFETLLETRQPNEALKFWRNDVYGNEQALAQVWKHPELAPSKSLNSSHTGDPENAYAPLNVPEGALDEPDSLPDGMLAALPAGFPRGRQFIVIDEWGPFDFRRPIAVLDTVAGNKYAIALIGPSGDWKLNKMRGVRTVNAVTGTVPAQIIVERNADAEHIRLEFEYTSPQSIATQFGEVIPAGEVYTFVFQRFEKKLNWKVQFFNTTDSIPDRRVFSKKPDAEQQTDDLWFAWWGSPAEGIGEDRFATRSTAEFDIAPNQYVIQLTADDGARLFLDGKPLLDRWAVQEPATYEIAVSLGGHHRIEIEHFENGGFATLECKIRPK
ncbi:MAG: right-handed parallel beta-helix repeat-containing protein [Lewinellaceae bacterium]|nr:right-handed parallel beta-helix repeat-containing protein [Lewinellaceae bacterium]